MIEANVHDGDILVINRSLEHQNGDMAVCFIDGEFTIKYIKLEKDLIGIEPVNEHYESKSDNRK